MVIKPNEKLHLSADELTRWPYWLYGWWGTDGCDWKAYPTDQGMKGIPDVAEEAQPLTRKQAAAWGLKVTPIDEGA